MNLIRKTKLAGLSTLSLLLVPGSAYATEKTEQPNILMIMVDDLGWGAGLVLFPGKKIRLLKPEVMRLKFLNAIIFCLITTVFAGGCKGRTGGEDQDSNIPVNAADQEPADTVTKTGEYIFGSDQPDEQLLREAAMEGNAVRVEQLVSGNTDVNASLPDGRTALMLAAFNGHASVMDILMNAGAEVELKDEHGRTALMYASTGHFPDAVKLLLENGADPNVVDREEKFSPLMFAAAEGHFEVVRILLENGADATLKDKDGDTAESFARLNGHERVAELLSRYQ